MTTPIDLLTLLYQRLQNDTALTGALSGDIYLLSRPAESDREDVVINSLPMTGTRIQLASANVNLYVPDLRVKRTDRGNAQRDERVANLTRLDALTKLVVPLIRDHATQTYALTLGNMVLIQEVETNSHYVNLRVDLQFFPN